MNNTHDNNGATTIIVTNNTPQGVYGMNQPQPIYLPGYQSANQSAYQLANQPVYQQPMVQPIYLQPQPIYQQPVYGVPLDPQS